jgi:GAF domain-containing protein
MANEVSHRIARQLDPDQLLNRIAEVVLDRLEVRHVSLFLIEQRSSSGTLDGGPVEAVLRASAGVVVPSLVLGEYCVTAGDDGIVAPCLATGQPQVVSLESDEIPNPDIEIAEGVRSIIALALRSRGTLLGALMIQSEEHSAFEADDVAILETVADQAAAAIDGAQLRLEAQQTAVHLETVVRQYVQESWSTLVERDNLVSGYRYREGRTEPAEDVWIPVMDTAVRQKGLAVVECESGEWAVAIPLLQNGVVVGVVGLLRAAGQGWSADEQAMLRAIGQQLTQSLENRRLFQVARDRARREYVLRQTTDKVRTQVGLDAVMRTAAEEMRRVAGATHVAIRLQTPSKSGEPSDGVDHS